MLNVETLNQELCTRAFTCCMLTKGETTNFVTGSFMFRLGPWYLQQP